MKSIYALYLDMINPMAKMPDPREFQTQMHSMTGFSDQPVQRKRDMKASMKDDSPNKTRFTDANPQMRGQFIEQPEMRQV